MIIIIVKGGTIFLENKLNPEYCDITVDSNSKINNSC